MESKLLMLPAAVNLKTKGFCDSVKELAQYKKLSVVESYQRNIKIMWIFIKLPGLSLGGALFQPTMNASNL